LNDWFQFSLVIIVMLIASNAWLIYRVLHPLRRLAAQTADLSKGDLAALQQPCGGIHEVGVLRHSMASMAGHVRRAQEEGHVYRHAFTNAQEAERARLAHELHDDATQSLIAITQSLDLAMTWIESDPARATTMLRLARTQAVESVEGLRRLITNLRPPALEELGLVPALQMLAESEADTTITVEAVGSKRRLDEVYELTLFRAAQEAVRNAQRHGKAKHVHIKITYQPNAVRLKVKDDGSGFQPPEQLDCLANEEHYGLLGMQERVVFLKGEIDIWSKPQRGTEVNITLPLATHAQPTETVCDPVCGALIAPQQAYGSVEYGGKRYYFCCPVCQGAFQRNPETYLTHSN
jgi:signal transduction histidine kinase/YHS domain-containing protein